METKKHFQLCDSAITVVCLLHPLEAVFGKPGRRTSLPLGVAKVSSDESSRTRFSQSSGLNLLSEKPS